MTSEQLVFVSYSRSEMYYAEAVNSALQLAGINVWFDLQELTPGSSWLEEIEQGLNACNELVLVVSRISLQSPWVAKEYQDALEHNKPVHLLLLEAVIFEGEALQNLLEKATSVIDARQNFEQTMTRLIQAIRGNAPTRDAVPTPNRFGIPTRLPLSLSIVAGGILLLIAMLLFLAFVSLQIYLPATVGSLLFTGLVANELMRFLTRQSYTGTRFTMFFAGLVALLLIPILSPVFFAIWLVSLLARDMTRWSPRGEGVRRGNESLPMLVGRLLLRVAPFFVGLLRIWFTLSIAIAITALLLQFVISPMFSRGGGGFFILIIVIGLLAGLIYGINRLMNWLIPERNLQVIPFLTYFVVSIIGGLLFSQRFSGNPVQVVAIAIVLWVVLSWVFLRLARTLRDRYFPTQANKRIGRVYRIIYNYSDEVLAQRIMEVLGEVGYRHQDKYVKQPVDYNFLLLTDDMDYVTRDLDLTQGRWVVLVGSQLEFQDWHQKISNYQWVDFRQQDMDQLRIMARDISDPTITRVSHDFSTRTTPQSFEQVVLPLRVKVYALLQSAFFIVSIVSITRQMNSFAGLSMFELIILMMQIVGAGASVWMLNRVIRRSITVGEILLINSGISIGSFLFGLFWGLLQPLPYGYVRDWGQVMLSLISLAIGITIGLFIGYRLLRLILGSWLPNSGRKQKGFAWARDRQLFIRNALTILFVGIITLTLLGKPIRYPTPLVVEPATAEHEARTIYEDIPLSAIIRRVNGTAGHMTADALNSVLSFSLTQRN